MNGLNSLSVCVLFSWLGYVCLLAHAQAPDAAPTPQLTPKAEQTPVAKAIPAEAPNRDKSEASSSEFCQCTNRDNSASTKKIEQALAGPLHSAGLNCKDRSLQDVVAQLSDEYNIPIQLNKTALEEAGIGTDSPVTVSLHNISLRSALKLTLRTLQLTWIVQDEVLMITTKEDAEKDLETCVYNVQRLVDDSDPKSVKALIDAIHACVACDSWAVNGGGQAEVQALPSGLLVVSQTQVLQEQVNALLNKIRKMREQAPLSKVGPRGYEPPPSRSSPGKSEKADKSGERGGFGGRAGS